MRTNAARLRSGIWAEAQQTGVMRWRIRAIRSDRGYSHRDYRLLRTMSRVVAEREVQEGKDKRNDDLGKSRRDPRGGSRGLAWSVGM